MNTRSKPWRLSKTDIIKTLRTVGLGLVGVFCVGFLQQFDMVQTLFIGLIENSEKITPVLVPTVTAIVIALLDLLRRLATDYTNK